MGATEINSNETVLVVTADHELLPLSTTGLAISGGRKSRVTSAFRGALVIHRDNRVERIDRINFLGFYGRTIWARLFSLANGSIRSVNVDLSEQPAVRFSDVKELVLEILRKNGERQASVFFGERPSDSVIRQVSEAGSCSELFAALGMPAPENALDILSPGHGVGR